MRKAASRKKISQKAILKSRSAVKTGTKRQANAKVSSQKSSRVFKSQEKQTQSVGPNSKITRGKTSVGRPARVKALKPKDSRDSTVFGVEPSNRGTSRQNKKMKHETLKTQKRSLRMSSPGRTVLIKQYETAVRLLYRQEFEKARDVFEKVIRGDSQDKEISERALTRLRLCEQKISQKSPSPRTVEDHYNLAVTLMNSGRYEEAINHLNKALKQNPKCDYVIYALAISNCRLGNRAEALRNLKLAINLKAENRFLAQRDPDFEPLLQDSCFISIVYPEKTASATP